MAKAPASDTLMTPEKMKPLLALSKQEPVQAAIGLTTDGEGLILLDKKAKPKKVLSLLRAHAMKSKLQLNNATLRFGRAEVDTDYDSGMVRFFVNKDAPGNMRVKLVEVVKRIPYQKVEINVDPSLEAEPEDDEAPDAVAAEAAPAATAVPQAPPAPPAPAVQPAVPDLDALRHDLAGLIRRIQGATGADPQTRARLAKLAGDANLALSTNNLNQARTLEGQLRQELDQIAPGDAPAGPTPQPRTSNEAPGVRLAKGLLLWNSTRGYVGQQVKKLQDAIVQQAANEPDFPAINANLGRLDAILEVLDDRLTVKLGQMQAEQDPTAKSKLTDDAKAIVGEYQAWVASDRLMADIDQNGFIPLDIRVKVMAALDGMHTLI